MKSLKEQLLEALDVFEKLSLSDAKIYTELNKERSELTVQYQKIFYDGILRLYKDAFLSRNGYRLYLPYEFSNNAIEDLNGKISQIYSKVLSVLQENGYYLKSTNDYIKNECYKKVATQRGEKEVKYNIGKILNRLKNVDLKNAFDSDPDRDRSKNSDDLMLCFSTHGVDIAGMSTDRNWTSCMNLMDGSNSDYVEGDVVFGTIICYLIYKSDKNIQNPLCRVLIKPRILKSFTTNVKDMIIYYPEVSVYGIQGYLSVELVKFLEKLCEKIYSDYKGLITNHPRLYNDVFNELKAPNKLLNMSRKEFRSGDYNIVANNDSIKEIVKECIRSLGNNADLNFIDVSKVTDMHALFEYSDFNGDISQWDVSNVRNMSRMFASCAFNGDISKWNVSNVIDMHGMFDSAKFNDDISNWDVSNVREMSRMFLNNKKFNGDISKWNVENVRYMNEMFSNSVFNGDISGWDVRNVIEMQSMFASSRFNRDINRWNVSKVNEMEGMFYDSIFNQPLDKWNPKSVWNFDDMFHESQFNQDINKWNVSNASTMDRMFCNSKFNQSLDKWDVGRVKNMDQVFADSPFNQDISMWNVEKVDSHSEFADESPLDDKPEWQPKFK